MKLIIKAIAIITLIFLATSAYARNIEFRVSAERDMVTLGKEFRLNLIFEGIQSVPPPGLPEIEGFQIQYLGPSTKVSIVNGRMTNSVTHMYTVVPLKVGKFDIGPFSFNYNRNHYSSNAIIVTVVTAHTGNRQPAPPVSYDERGALRDRVFLVMDIKNPTAYINEIIPLYIRLYVNKVSIRDIQYPEFSQKGFSVSGFDKPEQRRQIFRGAPYEVVEFKTFIFGTRTGKFVLSPARVKCNILVEKKKSRFGFGGSRRGLLDNDIFEEFFGGYDIFPLQVESEPGRVKILPLPKEGKPGDFTGAVGDFDFTLEVNPLQVRKGDPLTVKMKISGEGNLDTVMAPVIDTKGEFKAYPAEVSRQNNVKIFEQVLIPIVSTVKEIPAVSFSFFNPREARYVTVTSAPVVITVTKSAGVSPAPQSLISRERAPKRKGKETLGRDIAYIKEFSGRLRKRGAYLFGNKIFIFSNILIVAFFISLVVANRRKERMTRDVRYARRLAAPRIARRDLKKAGHFLKKGDTRRFYDTVFKTLQNYLGDKFHLPTHGITMTVVDEVLRPKGVREDILGKLKSTFEDCDLVRYAVSTLNAEKMKNTFEILREIIDYFERVNL